MCDGDDMKFQERDRQILQAIYNNDGVLAKRHLKAIFWPGKTWRAMERRLSRLHSAGYIAWPTLGQRKLFPIPEPVCWLGWQGALIMAGWYGLSVEPPKGSGENQLRVFHKRLRDQGIYWVREPRWSFLAHDLAVADFRLAAERGLRQLPNYTLEVWLPESRFRIAPDVITYMAKKGNGKTVRLKKAVLPDAYFEILDEDRRRSGAPNKARFLLEIDMGTHDHPSFAREKTVPGVAYIQSPAYKERFGCNSGHWLVVTNGDERRLRNLMQHTLEKVSLRASLFYFTRLETIATHNVFKDRAWWQAGQEHPIAILT